MIPVLWPDATLTVLDYLRPLLTGVTVTRTRQDAPKCVVVDTEWQNLETPISRRCTILLEVLAKNQNGTADVAAATALTSTVLEHLMHPPGGVVRFDQPVGPRVAVEAREPKFEFVEASIVWVFNA